MVFFLAALALWYDLRFKALFVIVLALFHDLQIVTIAYDKQVHSEFPETPTVVGLLLQSYTMGLLCFIQTIGLVSFGYTFLSDTFADSYHKSMAAAQGSEMDLYMMTTVFLQISNSSALLILSARTVGFFFTTMPAWQLLGSTLIGQLVVNVWILFFAGDVVSKMVPSDVAKIWAYDVIWLLIMDIFKMIAGAFWDKIKPWEIEHNPALVHEQDQARQSRRQLNCMQVQQGPRNALAHKNTFNSKGEP